MGLGLLERLLVHKLAVTYKEFIMAGIEKYSGGIGAGLSAIAEAIKTINALKFDAALRQAQRNEQIQSEQRRFTQQKELMGLQTEQAKDLETFKNKMAMDAEREERSRLAEVGKRITPNSLREDVASELIDAGLDPRNAGMFSSREELMRAKESGRASSDAAMLNALERAKANEETRKQHTMSNIQRKIATYKSLIDQNYQTVSGEKTPLPGKEGEIAAMEARIKVYDEFMNTGKFEDEDVQNASKIADSAANVAKQQKIVDKLQEEAKRPIKDKRRKEKLNTDLVIQSKYLQRARERYNKQLELAGWIEPSPSTQRELNTGKPVSPGISNLMDKGTIEQKDLTTLSDEELFQLATGGIK